MKSITATDRAIDKSITDSIKTFLATFGGTKTAGDYGTWDWSKAERLYVQVALRKNRRGNTGFRGDVVMGSTP